MKAAFRLPRKRCPRVYLCARSSQSTSALLPSRPRHSSLPFRLSFSTLSCRSRTCSFSFSLYTYISFPFFPFLFHYIFFSPIFEQLTFHRSSFHLIFPFYLSFFLSLSLFLSCLSSPFFLARFISARCQFEFGTRATGQRVSTKNQFLNARLFRAEGPACIFPSLPSPPLFASSLCATAASIFFDGTLTRRCIV